MVKKLNATITAALDKACPIINSKIVNKNNPWWTDQLTQMRKELYSLYDNSKLHPDNLNLYKTKLKNYRKKCRTHANEDARRIQEILDNEEEMAKQVNNLADIDSPKLSTLVVNGKSTDLGGETGKALLKAHYPGIKEKQETKIDRNKSIYVNILENKYDWINAERLNDVFRGFK